MSEDNLPIYVATNKFLAELHELGYDSIELDDLIDLLDDDPSLIEQMTPTVMMTDEIGLLSKGLAKFLYNRTMDARPT